MRPLLLLFAIAASAFAAPPSISIPAEVKPVSQYVDITPDTDARSVIYIGLSGVDPFPAGALKDPRQFILNTRGLEAGRYRFAAVAASKEGEQAVTWFTVVIGDAKPGPKPDVDPGPKPPDPKPDPASLPFGPLPGLRVLVVEESAARPSLPKGQQFVILGATVRNRLDSEAAKGKTAEGKDHPEYRIWDQDDAVSPDEGPHWPKVMKHFRDAKAAGKAKVPWLIAQHDGRVYDGPLPESPAKMIEVLDALKAAARSPKAARWE